MLSDRGNPFPVEKVDLMALRDPDRFEFKRTCLGHPLTSIGLDRERWNTGYRPVTERLTKADASNVAAWLPVNDDPPKTIKEWREARGFSQEDLARLVGADAKTICYWEHLGYEPTAQRGLALAWALGTPVDTIVFGRYLRGLTLPACLFILAARGRDDLGWKARIAEWRAEDHVDARFAARVDAGWLESGASAREALDRLEHGIRAAFAQATPPVRLLPQR